MKQNRKYVAIIRLKPKFVIGVTSGVEENLNGDGGWQDVRKSNRNGASTSNNVDQQYINGYGFGYRGGYNVRGRGGMKFVPVRNVGKRVDNVQVMECEGSGNRANKGKNVDNAKSRTVKKINEKSQVTIKNSFDALVDESVEIGGDEWTQMREKIDLATELGMQIDEREKKRWSEDLIKYYADKCKAKARQNLIVGLKWRIAKLKQDIVHGNTYVSKVANEDAEKQCMALMKTGGITRNQAFGKIYDETYRSELIEAKMMKESFQEGFVQSMDEEVAEDTSDSDKIGDSKDIYVFFIYKENNVKDTRDLWKNLKKHNNITGCFPWVLLGGFNVILNCNENSKGINVQSFEVQEFKKCVDNLSLEDIKLMGLFYTSIKVRRDPSKGVLKKLDRVMGNGHFVSDFSKSFANFLPFVSSDHSPAVLVMLEVKGKSNKAFRFMNYLADKKDFVDVVRQHWFIPMKGFNMYILTKRLKALKKHMRSLNKKNGNVCEKVKRLKVKLARVQKELSRDPSNVDLREEELIYIDAYKKATRDEELLLKQKSKIQWLKEGDFNTFFFHDMVKGRVTKNIIEVIYDDEGNTIHGSNMVDAFKLDAEAVMDHIKPISDCEIKVTLFDIEDNKASGLDGYSSKFFKAAWSVVGRDTYSAVREFFTCGKLLGEIMVCLTTASFSVCINGKPHGFFKAGRGLRQGDPISPYLFTLVMEVLNLMVIRQVKAEKRFKYHWGCKELKITSLCFVNDLLMLCHGDPISASVLRRGLDEFCVSSGLRPSMSKNEAFFRNVSDKVIDDIKLVMPFKVGVLPIKYLGVPMMSKRLQLISSVLSSMQVYWSSLFIFPIEIYNLINRLFKNFLWTRGESIREMVSVAWKEVCKPKSQGGLGLKPVHL
ncbi:RNA-directed DNA polymerase, eukaryota, reverse transcriptase zinc-binding domain protein [Tanacetum coccineum]